MQQRHLQEQGGMVENQSLSQHTHQQPLTGSSEPLSSSETISTTSQRDVEQAKTDTTWSKEKDSAPAINQSDGIDGGYGWVVCLAAFLINFNSWGINSSYGVFLSYFLTNNYYPGASFLEFAFVGGLSIGTAMLVAPLATMTTTRFGTKVTLCTGTVLETVALITAGSTSEVWQLFLSQGVAFGMGMGFLFVGSVGVVSQWFTKKRSLANGITTAGSGIGALTYNLASQAIIARMGLPWAYRILGICAFCATTFSMLIIKDRNEELKVRGAAFDFKLFKRWEFCLVQAWGFFSMLGYIVLLFSLPSYAKSIGLTSKQGAIIGALLNLGQGIGRPPVGYFSDVFGRINMAASATFLCGVFAFAIWIPAKSYGVLIFYAILTGTVLGTYWATISPVAAEVVGLQDLPSALSLSWLFIVLPTVFSEPIALEIAQHSPVHYLGTQLFAGFMYIAAALCLIPLRGWMIREKERRAYRQKNQEDEVEAESSSLSSGAGSVVRNMFRIAKV